MIGPFHCMMDVMRAARAPERGLYAASAQDELHDVGLFILKTAVGFNSASDPTVSYPAKCYLSVPAGVYLQVNAT